MAKRRGLQPIGDILCELMARTGFARVQGSAALEAAWRNAAGELAAQHTRVGSVKRGVLEIVVASSTLMQELTFEKQGILESLGRGLPNERICDLRFKLGAVR